MKRIVILIALLSVAAIAANAQFPNLNKIKEKVKKEEPKTQVQTNENNSGKTSEETETPSKAADFDSQYPPGVMFTSLLEELRIFDEGRMTIGTMTLTFLPPAGNPGDYYPYDLKSGGKLESVIKRKDGDVVDRERWSAQKTKNPLWAGGPGAYNVNLTPGEYVLELLVEDQTFYRFPFSVIKEGGAADPFSKNAGEKISLKGAWNDYAYLEVPEEEMTAPLHFYTYFRSPVRKSANVKLEMMRDGKLVGSSNADPKWTSSTEILNMWKKYKHEFKKPSGSNLIGTDVFGKDGNYKIVVTIDGELYGEYPFEIKNGKFVYLPEQTRGKADMTTFIEGGATQYFVKRQKGAM